MEQMMDIDTLQIVRYPHPALTQMAKPILEITPDIVQLAGKMAELCMKAKGLGLAANQVGIPVRLFVGPPAPSRTAFDPALDAESGLIAYINPVIVERSTEIWTMNEGCLSFPGIEGAVNRAQSVQMEYSTLDDLNTRHSAVSSKLTARVWQHECDHLDGVSIDESMLKKHRKRNRWKFEQMERRAENA